MDPDVRAKLDRALSALHALAADLDEARRNLDAVRAGMPLHTLDGYIDAAKETVFLIERPGQVKEILGDRMPYYWPPDA